MFGYIECNKSRLTDEELLRYQGVYCGLCRSLKERYGELGRLCLSYDMTFLILFLSSLYEPEEEEYDFRCGVHPLKQKRAIVNRFTDYAADMNVALAYFNAVDDWKDDKNKAKKKIAEKLKPVYKDIAKKYPRQCGMFTESIRELGRIEVSKTPHPDSAINSAGKMLSELFVVDEDFWSGSLRAFGYELGRFIYMMDATMDYKQDLRNKNYNPLYAMGKTPEEMEPVLSMPLGNAMEVFERLPIIQDGNILRNILYGGVWQQYYIKARRKEKPDG